MMEPASDDAPPGQPVALAPGVVRVLAPNPSPMTCRGTNTYLVGQDAITVVDPGPDDPRHLAAIHAALPAGARVARILVTHAHRDHAGLARRLASAAGAPVAAYGDAAAGRSPAMAALAASGLAGGGEGVEHGFAPDEALPDGTVVATDAGPLEAVWTPGHMGNHLCFAFGDILFSGDHVMGWASSLVSPPDGDMAAYRASLARIAARPWRTLMPGHGAPVRDPAARLAALAVHRTDREAAILVALAQGSATVETLTRRVYADISAALLPAASRNALAHLLELAASGRVTSDAPNPLTATWRREVAAGRPRPPLL